MSEFQPKPAAAPSSGPQGAPTGNKNASGHKVKAPNPEWYDKARAHFNRNMTYYGAHENYRLQKGRFYAGDSGVTVHIPKDWRKIKDPARPIVVTAPSGKTFHRNHAEARAAASLATKAINDAKGAENLKAHPLDDPRLRAALARFFRGV
ncbi:hypothetical protein ABIB48_002659 [Arthrobacter sp. UYCu511]|uniref:hypothetical protein n=1 Tax=Arthrobacter sp. UYCu511 TaxID=3156337 RepID=UPI00339A845E